jgi:hypothetical protein
MPHIFISYRREDAGYIAGILSERLAKEFGPESVFIDVDTIPFGVDFRKHINSAVSKCDVFLAIISDSWLGSNQGRRRIDDPTDFVRIETEVALQRQIPIIPILVGQTRMPAQNELPEPLRSLAFRNAAELRSGRDMNHHIELLLHGVRKHFAQIPPSSQTATNMAETSRKATPPNHAIPNDETNSSERHIRLRVTDHDDRAGLYVQKTGTPANANTKRLVVVSLGALAIIAILVIVVQKWSTEIPPQGASIQQNQSEAVPQSQPAALSVVNKTAGRLATGDRVVVSVVNKTEGQLAHDELRRVLDKINFQLREHFSPYWNIEVTARLILPEAEPGNSVVYVFDKFDSRTAQRFHEALYPSIPFSAIYTEVSKRLGESWSVTLSRAIMQVVTNPQGKKTIEGPDPENPNRRVNYSYDVCSPVYAEDYDIDNIRVSNFVLPSYFGETFGKQNDYLYRVHNGQTLRPFGINPGGYIRYFDPTKGIYQGTLLQDSIARKRLAILSGIVDR